jgi:O-antigen/teichoic acid export membrane protein
MDGTRMVCLFVLPAAAGLCCISQLMVPSLFGSRWMSLVPVLQILALWPGLAPLVLLFPYVYQAIGRPDIAPKIGMITLIYSIPVYILGAKYGLIPFTFAKASVCLAFIFPHVLVTSRLFDLPIGFFWRMIKQPVAAAGAMAAIIYPLTRWLSSLDVGPVAKVSFLFGAVIMGATIYIAVLTVLDRDSVKKLLKIGRRLLSF